MNDRKIVVISDCHVGVHNPCLARFKALNKYLKRTKPDALVCLGDFASIDSCSSHEPVGSKNHINKPQFKEELKLVNAAHEALFKGSMWHGDNVHFIMGNHEDRFDRWCSMNPHQVRDDAASALDLHTWWPNITPFKKWMKFEGIRMTHIPHNVMGRPIGGVTASRQVGLQSDGHCLFGHTHQFHLSTVPLFTGACRTVISAPAFMPQGHIEPYAGGNMSGWGYGFLEIRTHLGEEHIDVNMISTTALMKDYG